MLCLIGELNLYNLKNPNHTRFYEYVVCKEKKI